MKKEALASTLRRAGFGRDYRPVLRWARVVVVVVDGNGDDDDDYMTSTTEEKFKLLLNLLQFQQTLQLGVFTRLLCYTKWQHVPNVQMSVSYC